LPDILGIHRFMLVTAMFQGWSATGFMCFGSLLSILPTQAFQLGKKEDMVACLCHHDTGRQKPT
jgi:hypothetical protein